MTTICSAVSPYTPGDTITVNGAVMRMQMRCTLKAGHKKAHSSEVRDELGDKRAHITWPKTSRVTVNDIEFDCGCSSRRYDVYVDLSGCDASPDLENRIGQALVRGTFVVRCTGCTAVWSPVEMWNARYNRILIDDVTMKGMRLDK